MTKISKPKKESSLKKFQSKISIPKPLEDLIRTASPTGCEFEAQAFLEQWIKPVADRYESDIIGNRIAILNPHKKTTLMLIAHMDEVGLAINHVDEKGYIYFEPSGGYDRIILSARRVRILTEKGAVHGVIGRRAIHLQTPEDRKKVPEFHQMWIDIGLNSREAVLNKIAIGDPVVLDYDLLPLQDDLIAGRAFDDKIGCYIIGECFRRLVAKKNKLDLQIVAAFSTQEEIGTRGATIASYKVNPAFSLVLEGTHSIDLPDSEPKKDGLVKINGGPVLSRGPNLHHGIFNALKKQAEAKKIPYQVLAEPGVTGTDGRVVQLTKQGVATALISIPLRYMHTPCEVISLRDVENCINLIVAFIENNKIKEFNW